MQYSSITKEIHPPASYRHRLPLMKNDMNQEKKSSSSTTPSEGEEPGYKEIGEASRSRRPTFVAPETTAEDPKMEELIVPEEVAPRWTAKRVILVSWNYVTTVKGFLITIYMLNVIAWGGMLFLLLVNAAPAMCYPSCNDINSARRVWIEIDSQILNALFCVTGIGLLPWRLRDTYHLLRGNRTRLYQIHAGWYTPNITSQYKLVLVINLFLQNSIWQIAMAVTMWCMTRYNRPSWVTGMCIAVSFLCAIVAGGIEWSEVRKRKKLQKLGKVPPDEELLRRNNQKETVEDRV